VEPLVGLVLHGRQTQAVGGAPHIVQQLRALGFVVLGQTGKGQAAEQLLFGMAAPQGAQEGCAVKGWLIQGRSGSFRWLGERFEIASALLWQNELRHPASISCLERHSCPAGRCPNNSFLFLPQAAVVVVAAETLFWILQIRQGCGPAGFAFSREGSQRGAASIPSKRHSFATLKNKVLHRFLVLFFVL